MVTPQAIVAREQSALAAHRASLRGGELPAPKSGPRGTFVHGLMLPLSLFVAALRSPDLRAPFLRLAAVRGAMLAVAAVLVLAADTWEDADTGAWSAASHDRDQDKQAPPVDVDVPGVHVHVDEGDDRRGPPVDVDMPGLHVDIDETKQQGNVVVLGQKIPVTPVTRTGGSGAPPPTRLGRIRDGFKRRWKHVVELIGLLSIVEGIIVFFSRRWDDWLSFHISGLAGIRPESPEPPVREVSFDVSWIGRKLKRRLRGYLIFASGMPLLYLLQLVPVAGTWLCSVATTLWGWYWVGVFTAAKSAHAWADDGVAQPPLPVRSFNARFATGWWWPLRVYGRLWAWVVRGASSAAAAFDRSPAPFLGLALARAVLALPGLYLLARPIVPVAAGRLCAESDPGDRFVTGVATGSGAPSAPAAGYTAS